MESIGVRELRQNASHYLSRVAAGELIEVTDRGRPVARLVPITDDPWQDLINAGEVVRGSRHVNARDLRPSDYGFSGSQALQRLRADER
ncbi:MAG: type II toxin-antitoxin system Phd/YefM family antitoxin [Mycobacterium sp.]